MARCGETQPIIHMEITTTTLSHTHPDKAAAIGLFGFGGGKTNDCSGRHHRLKSLPQCPSLSDYMFVCFAVFSRSAIIHFKGLIHST